MSVHDYIPFLREVPIFVSKQKAEALKTLCIFVYLKSIRAENLLIAKLKLEKYQIINKEEKGKRPSQSKRIQ